MGDGRGEIDVPHPFAPDGSPSDFNLALVARETFATHPHVALSLVLAAVALEVASWSENPFAEQAVAFGPQGAGS